jgi:hypothetical protein
LIYRTIFTEIKPVSYIQAVLDNKEQVGTADLPEGMVQEGAEMAS